jgi:hypothetical protein
VWRPLLRPPCCQPSGTRTACRTVDAVDENGALGSGGERSLGFASVRPGPGEGRMVLHGPGGTTELAIVRASSAQIVDRAGHGPAD